jgi:hypothetical protein
MFNLFVSKTLICFCRRLHRHIYSYFRWASSEGTTGIDVLLLNALPIAEFTALMAENDSVLTGLKALFCKRSTRLKKLSHSRLEINESWSTAATTINNAITLNAVCNLLKKKKKISEKIGRPDCELFSTANANNLRNDVRRCHSN